MQLLVSILGFVFVGAIVYIAYGVLTHRRVQVRTKVYRHALATNKEAINALNDIDQMVRDAYAIDNSANSDLTYNMVLDRIREFQRNTAHNKEIIQ